MLERPLDPLAPPLGVVGDVGVWGISCRGGPDYAMTVEGLSGSFCKWLGGPFGGCPYGKSHTTWGSY